MAHPTAVILVVGLSKSLLAHAPRISAFARESTQRQIRPVLPALTCSAQATMLTGSWPSGHGIVGNGWYDRELGEVHFWKQSNRLMHGEKVWEAARRRDPQFTCANLCWWFNMNSSVDYALTPRPIYKADGRKIPDCYSQPAELRDLLQEQLGRFPLFQFWGPGASIASSRWIAQAAIFTHQRYRPTLNLVYLPHLDYALQKLGPQHPSIPAEVAAVDRVAGDLLDYYEGCGVRRVIVSEYGIEAASEPIAINRVLREAGALAVREEMGGELLDPMASRAFALADHQVAHVYLRDPADAAHFADLCRETPGVEQVLTRKEQEKIGLAHQRCGDLLLVARSGAWFSYHYWRDDSHAPDFARTVDIHRKPGYDPLELFLDPDRPLLKARLAGKLLARKLGWRNLLDVIPLDNRLVRGSHGRANVPGELCPLLITGKDVSKLEQQLACWQVRDVILDQLFRD